MTYKKVALDWCRLSSHDPTGVTQLALITSRCKGHSYLTVVVDLEERRVLHVVKGKDSNTIKEIGDYLAMKGVDGQQIT